MIRTVVLASNVGIQRFMMPKFAGCSMENHRPNVETPAKPATKPTGAVVMITLSARMRPRAQTYLRVMMVSASCMRRYAMSPVVPALFHMNVARAITAGGRKITGTRYFAWQRLAKREERLVQAVYLHAIVVGG